MTPRQGQKKAVSESAAQKKRQKKTKGRDLPFEGLIVALSNHDDAVRVRARQSLVAMGKAAVPLLAEALKSKNSLMRWEAAKALGEIGAPEAASSLVMALEDEEFDVRWLAATGLIAMTLKGLKPLLHALMEQGDSVWIREGAHHVIHDLAKGELRKYLNPVLVALDSIDPAVEAPVAALHALEKLEQDHKISDTWRHIP